MKPTKIVIVGGGSRSFGPAMIRDVLLSEKLCERGVELVLMDIVAGHLAENEAYTHKLMRQLKRNVMVSTTTSLREALSGADFVIVALEVERYLYWSMDFHIPRKYGFNQVYGENGGPGGLFHALRNMGPIVEVARMMEELCPQAWLLNFSNPEQKLCEAVDRLTSIRSVGLCHGVFMGQHQISQMLGIPHNELDMQACGLNHFTFFQTIREKSSGRDLYPELEKVERQARWTTQWHELALGRALFRTFGLWPSPATNHYGEYIRWAPEFMASEMHFYYDASEGEPWKTGHLPEFVYTIDGCDTHTPWAGSTPVVEMAEEHPENGELKPSGELAVPIIEGLVLKERRGLDAVVMRNCGAIPNLPDDAVVEVPAVVDGSGIQAVQMQPLPEAIAAMMHTQTSLQKLLVEAFAERSRKKLLQAILLDPTVNSYKNAVEMMNEMIGLQQKLLPQFVD